MHTSIEWSKDLDESGIRGLLRACPCQQCAVRCQNSQNHSLIITWSKDRKSTLGWHQGPPAIKARLNLLMTKMRMVKPRGKQIRICREHCWAIVSNSSWVRKNSKYLTLSREVRKWTKMWQTISEVRKFLSKITLQPTFSSVLKLNSKALHYFPTHKRWRHTICLKNQNYSCSTSAVFKF